MTVREIQSHLEEMYGTEASPTRISSVTDAVIDEVRAWQSRPLDTLYPTSSISIVFTSKCATARYGSKPSIRTLLFNSASSIWYATA